MFPHPRIIATILILIALISARAKGEPSKEDQDHARRLQSYLTTRFPDQVIDISADDDHLQIQGQINANRDGLQLAEVPMWQDITDLHAPLTLLPVAADADGKFSATIDRRSDKRDRLLSAWAIVRQGGDRYEPLSAMHYVDRVKPRADLPPAQLKSKKGLGGCPFNSPDLVDLGVSSLTLNIVLNEILHKDPAAGRTEYYCGGDTWYSDDKAVARYDGEMIAAARHGWMVSAIILIYPNRGSPKGSWTADAAWPFPDSGIPYVLPNFTTESGTRAYAATMNFLAERYSRPDGKYGRIHHWIMHNEVNSGFYWSNAGEKTPITYLELYQKSMRLTQLLARQYDPHAKALISLDHCWTVPAPGEKRGYPGRQIIDLLLDFSHVEGDFQWGIAYHPYAQDIFNPRTWEDKDAPYSFDAPFITFKNIEVLDAFSRLPSVEFQGKEPREIQLSEEGLNSRDYSEKSLTEQAAGLAYAWKKIEPLKSVTAFQYHHWSDAREEGGLRLGLCKFGDDKDDPRGKKPAYFLFRAIDTDQWESAAAFAKPIIGIKDWSEVPYRGEIKGDRSAK